MRLCRKAFYSEIHEPEAVLCRSLSCYGEKICLLSAWKPGVDFQDTEKLHVTSVAFFSYWPHLGISTSGFVDSWWFSPFTVNLTSEMVNHWLYDMWANAMPLKFHHKTYWIVFCCEVTSRRSVSRLLLIAIIFRALLTEEAVHPQHMVDP